jgi:Tfp pilus assembly protein PilO
MQLKKIGIYIIITLALLRFLIYPLHASIQEKKVLLGELAESYRIRVDALGKQIQAKPKGVVERGQLYPNLFEKGISTSTIQAEILEWMTKLAEKKGLTILNFEMLEPIAGKSITEIPILIRVKGRSSPFIEMLEAVEKGERALKIRSMEISRGEQEQFFSLTLSGFRVEKG